VLGGGLLVAALPPADGAEIIERASFPSAVADITENRQSLLIVAGGFRIPTLPPGKEREIPIRASFAYAVADLTENHQSLAGTASLLFRMPEAPADLSQIDHSRRLGAAIPGAVRGVQSMFVDGDRLGVVAARDQIAGKHGRQPDRVTRPSVLSGVPGDRDEYRPLGV
jgi:hypothetical protein